MKPILNLIAGMALLSGSLHAQKIETPVPAALNKAIPALMQRDNIPGLSIAYIAQGKVVWIHSYGVINADTHVPVTDTTIFEAASLTKVVTAYAAMKLVEAGRLSLDTPLNRYLGNNHDVGNDNRINLITARRVLTHSAGFPNWRNRNGSDTLLPINFTPGDKFSYSGEGFVYLAKVMEKITGIPYDQAMAQTVLGPLGMKHSSMTFQPGWRPYAAYRHDWQKKQARLADYPGFNAAASMRTTAKDYATFLTALVSSKQFKAPTLQQLFTPQIKVDTATPQLAWGLGVGLENTEKARYAWHWGDQGDTKALFMMDVKKEEGFVYFANSANGLSIAPDVIAIAFGKGKHDVNAFVSYGKFEPEALELVKNIDQQGAVKAMQAYESNRKKKIGEEMINKIGYSLLRDKKVTEALAVFTQNTKDYPQSSNVWDSLAEAYMEQGDKAHAIKFYEKTLAMDPANSNAVEQLKKLKAAD